MQPVCFVVMPFQEKPVRFARPGAPNKLNCDRLWDLAYRPALEAIGYLPVRADIQRGTAIIKDMFLGLTHAPLVMADLSLDNGNVYYELGVRHVAAATHCVSVAADWSRQLFDVDQFRLVRFPLSDGAVPDAEAEMIKELLIDRLPPMIEAATPYHALVAGTTPEDLDEHARCLGEFQQQVSAVRFMPGSPDRQARVRELMEQQTPASLAIPEVAIDIIFLLRDLEAWQELCDFVQELPTGVKSAETVSEQYSLALSNLGRHEDAVAGIEELNRRFGPTPERCGLLGGRFKRLYRTARGLREESGAAQPSSEERRYLNLAISHYTRGTMLDLNEYYCACNLPSLLRLRGRPSDVLQADEIETLVLMACQRALAAGDPDEWLCPTLFGIAFRRGDIDRLQEKADELEGGASFHLGTTLEDAPDWIQQAPPARRPELEAVLDRLRVAYDEGRRNQDTGG